MPATVVRCRPRQVAGLILAALVVASPGVASAQSRNDTLKALGVAARDARDVRWRSASRSGDTLTLADVRVGDQRWRSVVVTFEPDGAAVRSIRLDGLTLAGADTAAGSIEVFQPQGSALRTILQVMAAGAERPGVRPADGRIARAVGENLAFSENGGDSRIDRIEVRGLSLDAGRVSLDAVQVAGMRHSEADGSTISLRAMEVLAPSPEVLEALTRDPADAPGAALGAIGFRALTMDGFEANLSASAMAPAATAAKAAAGAGTPPGPFDVKPGASRISFDRLALSDLTSERLGSGELTNLSMRVDDAEAKPMLTFGLKRMALTGVDIAYWRSYAAAFPAMMRAASASPSDAANAPPSPDIPLPKGGPLDWGADTLGVDGLAMNIMGLQMDVNGFDVASTRDAAGNVTRMVLAPGARIGLSTTAGGALSPILKAGLGAIGYQSIGLSFGAVGTWDPATDTAAYTDSYFAMREGFRLDYAMTLGGMSRIMEAAAKMGASPTPSPEALTAIFDSVTVGPLRLRLADEGILARTTNAIAQAGQAGGGGGQSPQAMREGMAQSLETSFIRSKGPEALKPLVTAFAEWLRVGGQVEINAAPAKPVSGKALRENTAEALKALNLTARQR